MRNVVVAAAAGLALLVADTEIVRAEEGARAITKPLEMQETREAGFAVSVEDRGLVQQLHFASLISKYAKELDVPFELARAVVQVESNFRPTAKGAAGEIGLMQIKPATARMMGYEGPDEGLFDPDTNIRFGMKYLARAHDLGDGKLCRTILKYNAGHAAKRMNPVSRRYCNKVEAILDDKDAPVPAAETATAQAKAMTGKEASGEVENASLAE